ncbi:PLP-dependent aminotransferase family protein [Johnsonella ignava]|uniref:MocR-like pyridoxine biosynthesis transcription factor PdxR n=1 Tax=Johnsonella ignava TaxID=43995 RepID=UPI0023F3CE3E|nr:PLP-dependent aminotransferase family protein [Johnsonella ignava]
MELIIPLKSSKKPIYEQIYEYIKNEIKSGNLRTCEKLPSTRKLSSDLKISRSTVQLAYAQLEAEGYVEACASRGYFISKIEELYNLEQSESLKGNENYEKVHTIFKEKTFSYNNIIGGKDKESTKKNIIDFSPRGIDFSAFPYTVWRKLSRDTFADDNTSMFSSGDHKGELALREAIASYLHHARAVEASADRVIIGAGNEYLMLVLGIILGKRRIAIENPTYKQAYRVLKSMGWDISAISMDESGVKTSDLKKSCADIVYTMPSHQYPTGIVMSASRRSEIINWAVEDKKRYIIEDDYDSEFRYKGRPIPAMQGMGGADNVIYIGTFSKAIAPAIRVSFMLLPDRLMEAYERQAGFLSCTVPRPFQNILYNFIADGHFERHLNRMRKIYKSKHDIFIDELKPFLEKFDIIGSNAGHHLILKSKTGKSAQYLAELAAQKGVKVYPIDDFFIDDLYMNDFNSGDFDTDDFIEKRIDKTVILGYAPLSIKDIRKGLLLLKEVWL